MPEHCWTPLRLLLLVSLLFAFVTRASAQTTVLSPPPGMTEAQFGALVEAISNAVRHGEAKMVEIGLRKETSGVTLRIRDDGIGMPKPLPKSPGIGLRTMAYRASLIGATLEISPARQGGTEIVCMLPRGS